MESISVNFNHRHPRLVSPAAQGNASVCQYLPHQKTAYSFSWKFTIYDPSVLGTIRIRRAPCFQRLQLIHEVKISATLDHGQASCPFQVEMNGHVSNGELEAQMSINGKATQSLLIQIEKSDTYSLEITFAHSTDTHLFFSKESFSCVTESDNLKKDKIGNTSMPIPSYTNQWPTLDPDRVRIRTRHIQTTTILWESRENPFIDDHVSPFIEKPTLEKNKEIAA
jgi:hypothetical protein